MSYVSLNDLITDEQVLEIAKQHINDGTFPTYTTETGKTTLTTSIVTAILYLMEKGYVSKN